MVDKWWAREKCPDCHILFSSQRWGGGDFRLTCEDCGFSKISRLPYGNGDFDGLVSNAEG